MNSSFMVAVALAGATGLTRPAPTVRQSEHPNFAGHWVLNTAESDNPRELMRGDTAGGERAFRGGGGGRRGGGGDFGGGGRGGFEGGESGFGGGNRGRPDSAARARMRRGMQIVFNPPAVLDIEQSDSAIHLEADGGPPLLLPGNGHKVKQKAVDAPDVEISGQWKDYHVLIERKGQGFKIDEEYLRSVDGKQLYVIVKFDSGRGDPVQFRRVYDRKAGD